MNEFLRAVAAWSVEHPLIALSVGGALVSWAVGGIWRQSHRSLRSHATPVIGLIVALGGITYVWKNRQDLGRAMAALIVAATIAGWALAAWLVDGVARTLLVTAGIAGALWLSAPGGRLDSMTGGRPLGEWWDERLQRWSVQHAVATALPGASASDVRVTDRGVEATVRAPAHIDPTRSGDVGAQLNARGVVPSHHSALVPTVDGAARLVVHSGPEPSPWEALATLDNTWRGPHSTNADDPVSIAVRPDGSPLLLPCPGVDGGHWIIAGGTGSGKSTTGATLFAELAWRPNLSIVDLDPHGAEATARRARATFSAFTREECIDGLGRCEALLDERLDATKGDLDDRATGRDWPRVVILIEEFAALGGKGMKTVLRLAAEARKVGIGVVLSTQRPSYAVLDTDARANFLIGVGHRARTATDARVILGEDPPPLSDITVKGGLWARHEVDEQGRAWLLVPADPSPAPNRPYRAAAREIAQATSHLRVGMEVFR